MKSGSFKVVIVILGVAILISSGIMLFLVKKGAALRPAGVIQATEIGSKPDLIAKSLALRLFPEFQPAKNVIWYMEIEDASYSELAQTTLENYQVQFKPTLIDLRKGDKPSPCEGLCWYVLSANAALPDDVLQKMKAEPTVEIFVQYFNRNEEVPEVCETEKTLEPKCVRPISLREVKKKIKHPGPYFFMRRYLDSKFYLFIEKN